MTSYEFGDIVLLEYPYSDLKKSKKRPAMVLADTGDQDLLMARVTSEKPRDSFDLSLERWHDLGLLLPSCIRLAKIATLQKNLVLKKMGKLGSPERRKVRSILKKLFGFS